MEASTVKGWVETMKKGSKSPRRILKKIILYALLLLVLAGAGFYGYSMLRQEYTVTYDSYITATGSISNALSFSGNFSLVNSKSYTASAAGTVRNLYVAQGDQVQEGDRLLRLSSGETVSADFTGRINTVSVQEGDTVAAGDALLQLADFTNQQVSIRIDEYDIASVSVGQSCTITATATEQAYASQIASINYISSSTGSVAYYTAVAYVTAEEGIYPGMQATVSIPQQEAVDVVILKADAISFDERNQAFVWMENDAGELEQVNIQTGVSNGNYVEITSGLAAGEEVFVASKEETASAMNGLLSSLFGGQQYRGTGGGNTQNRGNYGGGGVTTHGNGSGGR